MSWAARDADWPERLREFGNWLNLSTPAGLLTAVLGRATITRAGRGLWHAEGYRLAFPIAGAFTIGNVILTPRTFAELQAEFPNILVHEERHTWQYLCCGAMFGPLYVAAMVWSFLGTGDRAAQNVFEVRAGLTDGGYRVVEEPRLPRRRPAR